MRRQDDPTTEKSSEGELPHDPAKDRPARNVRRRWPAAILSVCVWLYVAGVFGVWLLLRLCGDRWWFATVMLFGPRWIYAAPWVVLSPLAAFVHRRLLWPLAAAAIVLLGPIMGLHLPWRTLVSPEGATIRVLTCNIDRSATDVNRLGELVESTRPDVVALQECPEDVASTLKWPAGWSLCRFGGLLIASPHTLQKEAWSQNVHPPCRWPPTNGLRCRVEAPQGAFEFCCVHLTSPRWGLSEVLDHRTGVAPERSGNLSAATVERRLESEDLEKWIDDQNRPWIAAGDFNLPADSVIYQRVWGKYDDAFSVAGFGFGYSKWTPIRGWTYGLRIDHILGSPGVKAIRCWVGPDVGSDHVPVLADLALPTEQSSATEP